MLKATSDDKLVTLINIFTVAPENHDALARLLRQGAEEMDQHDAGLRDIDRACAGAGQNGVLHLRRQFHRHCWRLNCGASPVISEAARYAMEGLETRPV